MLGSMIVRYTIIVGYEYAYSWLLESYHRTNTIVGQYQSRFQIIMVLILKQFLTQKIS